jgi:hypothetical protein
MKTTFSMGIAVILFGLLALPVTVNAQDEVYGWQLMSEQERAEHRTKMQNMKTKEERERYRYEHHQKMQQRAKQQGVTLPDMPHDRIQDRTRDMDMNRDRSSGGGVPMGGQGGGKR